MKSVGLSESLIENDKYQVLVCCSPANIMVGFAAHTWLLVNRNGKISRWEVLYFKKDRELSMGHLHKDYFGPFEGIEIWPHYERYHWQGKVLGMITGDESSVAADMANLIESSFDIYPSIERYSLIGPNSNTYTQWVLNQFPEVNIRLPWNAFGRKHMLETPSN